MTIHSTCLICHKEIPHPGAECPYCKSRAAATAGATPLVVGGLLALMVLCFVVTGLLAGSFHRQQDSRFNAYLASARSLSARGSHEEALAGYRSALLYRRQDVAARLGLAEALYSLGRFSEAESHLTNLRTIDPTNAVVNRLLGRIAVEGDRLEEAASYFRTAIYGRWQDDPEENRLQMRFELIELLESAGNRLQIASELMDLRKEAPDDPIIKKRIGWLLMEAGVGEQAIEIFAGLTAENSADAEAWAGLGEAEFSRNHFLSARTAFSRSLSLDSSDPDVREWLELCRQIVDLDPTLRRMGTRERYQRSLELVRRALAELQSCLNPLGDDLVGPPAPLPDAVRDTLQSARDLLDRRVRQRPGEESVGANVALAQDLHLHEIGFCPGRPAIDRPLKHVLAKLVQ